MPIPHVMRVYIRQRVFERAKEEGINVTPHERDYLFERAVGDVERALEESLDGSYKLILHNRKNELSTPA